MRAHGEQRLTGILREDAQQVCTPDRMEQIWTGIHIRLEDSSITPSYEGWRKRFLIWFAALFSGVALACYGLSAASLLPPIAPSGYVLLPEEPIPLAASPDGIRINLMAIGLYIGTGAAVAALLCLLLYWILRRR